MRPILEQSQEASSQIEGHHMNITSLVTEKEATLIYQKHLLQAINREKKSNPTFKIPTHVGKKNQNSNPNKVGNNSKKRGKNYKRNQRRKNSRKRKKSDGKNFKKPNGKKVG